MPLFVKQTYVLYSLFQYRKVINAIKLLLLVATLVFIFYKLFFTYKINDLWETFRLSAQQINVWLLIAAVVLVVINWGIETIKWHLLINKFERFTFALSVKSVLSGIALSIITPNQLGDFIGRVIHLQQFNKIKGSLVAVVGHTAQVFITLIAGIFGLFILVSYKWQYVVLNHATIIGITALFFVLLALLFTHIGQIFKGINKLNFLHKIHDYLQVFTTFSRQFLMRIFLLSFLRYLVFFLQYALLLWFFGIQMPALLLFGCIALTFCVQSIVPSFILLEIGLRGASALWFFGMFSQNQIGILLSAYSLWIINMMLPALPGLYFIYKVKLNNE